MHGVTLAPGAIQKLIAYRWPGNVRQLENVLERMVLLSRHTVLTEEDLPEELLKTTPLSPGPFTDLPEQGLSLEAVERDLISRALDKFKGNQSQTARYLDISRRTLNYRMEKHGLIGSFPPSR